MRRFRFSGGDKGEEQQGLSDNVRDEASGHHPTAPTPAAPDLPPAGEPASESWMPAGQEAFAPDEPAPIESPSAQEPPPAPESPPMPESPPAAPPQTGEHPMYEPPRTEAQQAIAAETASRVSVIDEQPVRPAPPEGASEEEYKWHTYRVYPSNRPDAVEFIDLYKAFGRNRILRGLNMGLPEGMVSMILGPSGTGKSVCIKHMVGLLYPDDGDCLVHGESVPNMPDDDLFEMRKKFGLLFQDGALFGSMNLYDNVAFPLRQHTEKGEDEIEDIVMRRLNEVGLGHSRDKYPNELSGGMRKRAGFARALVLGPDIVLFDEPDSGLDPVRTSLLGELILEVHRDMMDEAKANQKTHLPTFSVITHNVMMARRVADYINVLWKGRIVEAGPTHDMLNSDNPFIRQFLAGESQGPLTMD
jgi:phospholipid/cholesterol/gamma-HCH transport system ATP-binding protein